MSKHPTVGKVKTRLGESIGHEETAQLYTYFLKDTVEKIKRLGVPFFIYYSPEEKKEEFECLLGNNLTYVPQRGIDLGERLYNGFKKSLRMGHPSAIALASDTPDLPESILVEAGEKLRDFDSVIGPSSDGGYYLIGLRNHAMIHNLFQGIVWSTETVFTETMKKIETEQISCYILEPWKDIDQADDLKQLLSSEDPVFHRSFTWKYMEKLRLSISLD